MSDEDPHFANVVLLIGNTTGNANIIDESPRQMTLAMAAAPSRPGMTPLNRPPGGIDSIIIPPNGWLATPATERDNWQFGTDDFTIEGYFRSLSSAVAVLWHGLQNNWDGGTPTVPGAVTFWINSSTAQLNVGISSNGTSFDILNWAIMGAAPQTINAGIWYYFCLQRIGNNFYGAVNDSNRLLGSSMLPLWITPRDMRIAGYADNQYAGIRITKGIARYGAGNFPRPTLPLPNVGPAVEPPPPPPPPAPTDPYWSNVILLTANGFGFSDQSVKKNMVSPGIGHPDFLAQTTTDNPPPNAQESFRFLMASPQFPVNVYNTDSTVLNLGSSDFCIEFYVRRAGANFELIRQGAVGNSAFLIECGTDGIMRFSASSTGTTWDVINGVPFGSFAVNTWTHVAVFRVETNIYGAIGGAVTNIGNVGAAALIALTSSALTLHAGNQGQLAGVRITKGQSRYTLAPFTPPPLPFPTSDPPVIFTRLKGDVDHPFLYTITATGDPTQFTALDPLPDGLTLDSATGVIFGTPTETGTFQVRIRASNAIGDSVCDALLEIVIAGPPIPIPEIISPLAVETWQGEPFQYLIEATNEPFEFNAIDLPAGLSVDTETGLITGTPMSDPGVFQVKLSATNDLGTGTATLLLTVREARPPAPWPVITSPDTASGTVGLPFTYIITARNGPISFYASGLPNGLAINTLTGSILGTPREMGTFHVTLSASNANGTGTMILILSIAPAPAERPCPPPPPRKNLSGPDVPGIFCRPPDGCCGLDMCTLSLEDFICQIRSLLPEGEIFNNTRRAIGDPPKNVGTITVGCAKVGCEQLIFGGCCDDQVFCDDDPIAPQLAVVDSFAAVVFQVIQALCAMLPELDACTADGKFVNKWATRMGITRRTKDYDPCGPEFSDRILAFLICFILQLRYNRQRAVNWEYLTMIANRMGADIKMRYAGDLNGTANTDEPYLSGWWTMARDQPVCPPRMPCPPDPQADLGSGFDQVRGGQALDPVACAPPNENSPLSLNIIVCPSDIIVPENCNLPLAMQQSPLPHDPELYDAFWWLLPKILPAGPLYCIYECCEADCIV